MHPVAERLLALLETRRGEYAEFDPRIDKYDHSLQCARRAQLAGESDDYVVMVLFHDVFGGFEPLQHGNMAGVVLRPWIGKEALLACFEHPFAVEKILRGDTPTRLEKESPAYRFATVYDIPGFDPDFALPRVEAFHPLIEKVIR